MKVFSILFIFLVQFCSNQKNTEKEVFSKRESIVGKWQLYETCISPGSACVVEKVENGLIVEFTKDGKYKVTNSKETDGIYGCDGEYKLSQIETIPVQNVIEFSPSCNKALWTLYYQFNVDNSLNINPQCIEECRFTYKPIN